MASPPVNLSFEIAGATPGSALGWTSVSVCTASEIADYKTGKRGEDFSGWITGYIFGGFPAGATAADGGDPVEPVVAQFEHGKGWLLDGEYKLKFLPADTTRGKFNVSPSLPSGTESESFSIGYSNDGYRFTPLHSGTDTEVAQYDGQPAQRADSWIDLSGYKAAFAPGDTAPGQTEAFSIAVLDTTWTATASSATLHSPNPPMVNAGVLLSVDAGGTLASPFVADQPYYVVAQGAGTFQLSATQGGSPIAATSTGSGTMWLTVDEKYGWALLG